MQRPIKTYSSISTKFAEPTKRSSFGKHLGVDYAAGKGTTVYAPVSGKVTQSYYSASVGHTIEIAGDDGRLHRLLHLNTRGVGVGARVREGQAIATSGNTGSNSTGYHLHWDVRKGGTTYNASFSNYVDPETLLAQQNAPKPASGRVIHLDKGTTSTVFRRDNGQKAGTIYAKDDSYNYQDRGQDPKFPNRRYIYSASAGGDVSIAMTYTDGKPIEGRRYK